MPLSELRYFVRNVLAAVTIADKNGHAFIIALKGDLGAGKTTFVQALAREFGITDTVQSPTYVIMKKYTISLDSYAADVMGKQFKTLVHIDAYRLEKPEEIEALRPEEFLKDPSVLVCLEWPEKVEGVFPEPDMTISFSSQDALGGERYITLI